MSGSQTGTRSVCSLAFAFAALGGTAAVIPAIIPAFAADLEVQSAVLLPAIPALFTGLLVGVLSTSFASALFSLTSLLRAGAAAQALGLAVTACAPAPLWFVVGAALAGFGFGIVEAAGTAAVRVIRSDGIPRALTKLTLIISIVATVTPLAVLASAMLGWARPIPLLIAVVQLGVVASLRRIPSVPRRTPGDGATKTSGAAAGAARPGGSAHTAQLSFLAAALFCYVGTESVISGWSASTLEHNLGASAAVAPLGTSAFWLLMSLGRMSGVAVTGRVFPGRVALGSTALIALALCGAALLQGPYPLIALLGLGLAVFASGSCYGLLIGTAVERTPERNAVHASSAFVALGAAGGATIPFIAASVTLSSGQGAATTTAAMSAVALFVLFVASLAWRATPTVTVPAVGAAAGTARTSGFVIASSSSSETFAEASLGLSIGGER
ncbi:MFS transporter [Cryobacterium aureum]|uniref:MFS transporter n=1 Tax=Cryobacterium aureum TaxID=995037 RepID=UPI000CF51A6B|nr:MFS transporter [Cryobacterium aureum]